jgi:hypothetical protein
VKRRHVHTPNDHCERRDVATVVSRQCVGERQPQGADLAAHNTDDAYVIEHHDLEDGDEHELRN